jgi:hypothetical protein
MKLAIDQQNLEAFRKASRNMKKLMDYRMAKAVTKILKNHTGTQKAKAKFISSMEHITSFSKSNIPLSTLKRMEQKGIYFSQGTIPPAKVDLRKANPELYKKHKVAVVHTGRLCELLRGEAAEDRGEQTQRRVDEQSTARTAEGVEDPRGIRHQDELRLQEDVLLDERRPPQSNSQMTRPYSSSTLSSAT